MNRLRNHLHALLIVPLVVIAVTWPVFPSIFNGEEFWLINHHPDHWLRLWHAWHLERALAGQTELYYTDAMFHPLGTSAGFQRQLDADRIPFASAAEDNARRQRL